MKKTKLMILTHGLEYVSGILTGLLLLLFLVTGKRIIYLFSLASGWIFYHTFIRLESGDVLNMLRPSFDYGSRLFRERENETKIYEKMGIRKWKKYLPTYVPGSFDISKRPIRAVIYESCKSETDHIINLVFNFGSVSFCLLTRDPAGNFWFFFLTAVAGGFIETVFIIEQRYNRPRLVKLMIRRERTEGVAVSHESADTVITYAECETAEESKIS
jgi:hypothetical protein